MNAGGIPFHLHDLGKSELASVAQCFDGPMLTTGPLVRRFEGLFAEYLQQDHCVAVSSCTSALHLALESLGLRRGDEVLIPGVTFAATALAVLHAGGEPVLVDVQESDGLLDLDQLLEAASPRTRAVIPVHLYGQMVDMIGLRKIALQRDWVVVEDAAHAIESQRDGVRPGQLSSGAAFSFYATKNLTCGEGGAFVTASKDLAQNLRRLRVHGLTKTAADRVDEGFQPWDIPIVGWKYNMDDIHASLLIPQLPLLEDKWNRRSELVSRYNEHFRSIEGIQLPHQNPGKSAFHLYPIRVPAGMRELVMDRLRGRGIGFSVHYPPLKRLGALREYRRSPMHLPVSTAIGETTLSLPLYPRLRDDEVDEVAEVVLSVFE
jgi:dTDP-4-amino-4,6-dideoxygalactose transaminase